MLLDANLLLCAVHRASPFHVAARDWLTGQLSGPYRVGIPWQSLSAFVRIVTHPRAFERPLAPVDAWTLVTGWLEPDVAWIPQPGDRHAELLGELIVRYDVRGNLVPDAQLAALALEHGLTMYSTDTDFARFPEMRWVNPLAPASRRRRAGR